MGRKKKQNSGAKAPQAPGAKAKFNEWLRKNSLRPLVLGDDHFGFRLHSFFLGDELFTSFDPEGIFERDLEPNYIILIGPVNEKLERHFQELKERLKHPQILYIENVFEESDIPKALSKMESMGIKEGIVKEFVTMENIKEAVTKAANV